MELIEKAKIELLSGRGNVNRKIYKYEDKMIFKHTGSWHFCKEVNGQWKQFEIRIGPYKILKPTI